MSSFLGLFYLSLTSCSLYFMATDEFGSLVQLSSVFYYTPHGGSYTLCNLPSYILLFWFISSSNCLVYLYCVQMITMPSPGSFDLIRTTRMTAYGLLILGPSQHLWFNFMSTISPTRDLLSTFKKMFLGQAVYGPIITSVFFSYNASLQGESGREIAARLNRDLLPTMLNGLLYWPVCDFVTYKFVPVHLQPLINSSFQYVWTIYLTYMASLKAVDIN